MMSENARKLSAGTGPKSGRRVLVIFLVLIGIAAVIGLGVMLAHRSASGGPGGPGGGFGRGGRRPSTTVGVATASPADVPVTLDGLGTVTPAATVTVTPQVSGVITQILYREGQIVKKGETLAVIDPRPFQMALEQAQGTLARDQAQLDNAKILLQRDQTLLTQDSIARQDVDTQSALVRQLSGTVTTDKAAVGTAQLNLGYSRITAPVGGRVGLRVVDLGNYVSAGAANGIAVITEVTPIDIQFTLPQDDVPRVQAQANKGKLVVTALDRTKTVVLDNGVFSTLDNLVDTATGTIRAKARFPNTAGKLFPNQFVNVRINLETLKGAIVVPVTAVRTGAQGDFVWKLNPDKTVTMRKVTRGPGTATTTSIVQGLTAGEKVITEGGDRLTEGAKVMLPGDRPSFAGRGGRHHRGGAGGGAAGAAAPAAGAAAPAQGAAGQGAAGQGAQPTQPQAGGQAAAGGQQGPGGAAPSPEMLAARQAMMTACAADAKTLCAGQEGREMFMCMRENADKLSQGCKGAMAKMPHRRPAAGDGA
jgi:multidrug efflux system membrane fusion protein